MVLPRLDHAFIWSCAKLFSAAKHAHCIAEKASSGLARVDCTICGIGGHEWNISEAALAGSLDDHFCAGAIEYLEITVLTELHVGLP